MAIRLDVSTEGTPEKLEINEHPDTCPKCLRGIDPRFRFGYLFNKYHSELIYQCPRQECRHLFIGYYTANVDKEGKFSNRHYLRSVEPHQHQDREFSKHITTISSAFVRIFNQAHNAEGLGLSEIAGPGYRKALEFLIKDYCTFNNPEAADDIKKTKLSSVIDKYVDDARVQSTAKLATWLGNDETHYYRIWGDKDISDLKSLIELTGLWIDSVEITRQYQKDMGS